MQTIKYIVNRSNPWKSDGYIAIGTLRCIAFDDILFSVRFILFIVIHPRKHIVNDHKLNITIVYELIWILNYIS